MKKSLLFIMAILAVYFLSAQTVINFEDSTAGPLTLHVMGNGAWDDDATHPVNETFMIVDNPDISGINKSSRVMKFVRRGTDNGGLPWGGFWANSDPAFDVTNNHYVHVKVWKSRVSPLKFKLEGGPSGTLETASMNEQSDVNTWVDIVFDFTSMDSTYPVIALMPDFEDPLAITDDIDIYIDDIMSSNDSTPIIYHPFTGLIDFEDATTGPLTLHVMGNGDWDNVDLHPVDETFMIVDNPYQTGINTSSKVMKFVRRGTDNGGLPWGGFWANSDGAFDITGKQYVHVKVWKSRISPMKFKLEGGTSGTLETPSMNEQSATDKWVDIVFDFTSMDGSFPVIALMPDFEDPLTITDDIDIYFDDIMVSDDPTPILNILGDFNRQTELNLFPNPCNDIVNIETSGIYNLTIYNLIGQEVYKQNELNKGTNSIDLSELKDGVYIVSLRDKYNNETTSKLFKQ